MFVLVDIAKDPDSKDKCYLNKKIKENFSIDINEEIVVILGQKRINAKSCIYTDIANDNIVWFSKNLVEELNLPEKMILNISVIGNNTIKLGPVIGIFVNPRYITKLNSPYPPESAIQMKRANIIGKGFIYYFTCENIYWLRENVKAWYFSSKEKKWKNGYVPLPDVIYDRGVNFFSDEKIIVNHIREQFLSTNTLAKINSVEYLDKLGIYQKINKYTHLRKYLPKIVKYSFTEDIKNFLDEFRTVHVERVLENKKSETLTITLEEEGLEIYYYFKNNVCTKRFASIESIAYFLEMFFKDEVLILQGGIDRYTYKGMPIDLRILLQKDHAGNWLAVYNHLKIIKNKYTENKVYVYNFKDVAPYIFEIKEADIIFLDEKIRKVAISIAEGIEKEFGNLGELAVDLMLDKKLNVWFIDANLKPAKNPIRGVESTEDFSPQYLLTILYSKYISKFTL